MDKRNFSVVKVVSKDTGKLNLCGVCVEPSDATIATNGHLLAAILPAAGAEVSPDQACVHIISTVDAKILAKESDSFELADIEIESTKDPNAKLELRSASGATRPIHTIDAGYVNWRQVIPTGVPLAKVCLDAEYLRRLLDVAIVASKGREVGRSFPKKKRVTLIDLEFHGETSPVVLRSEHTDKTSFVGVVMPVKKS